MDKWKLYSLKTDFNNKDKSLYPKNIKNLFQIFFFKKKKSSIFFFKSEPRYKANIDFKINLELLNNIIQHKKEIPYKEELIYFFSKYVNTFKINNINEIENNINLGFKENLKSKKKQIVYYNKNIIYLDKKIVLDLKKKDIYFSDNLNNKNIISGNLIFNELYQNNLNFLNNIIENNNLNLLIISESRFNFYQNNLIEEGVNFTVVENNFNNIEFEKYDLIVVLLHNIGNESKKKNSDFFSKNCWNNLILDIDSNILQKNDFDFIHEFKFNNKIMIINKFQLLENYNSVLNLYFKNYDNIWVDINSFSNSIDFNTSYINKDFNIKNRYLKFNQNEKMKYQNYISKFTSFYSKNNILFTDDVFLRKFCCYPQKNLKINFLNYKNLSSNLNLLNIEGNYKETIAKNLRSKIKSKNTCNVCLNNISNKNFGVTTCGHFFCYTCIYKCINYKNECPVCRHKLTNDNIYYLKIANNYGLNKEIMDNSIIDDLGTKIKELISLIKKIQNVAIFSNFTECLDLLKNNFKQLNIPYYDNNNTQSNIILLNYDFNTKLKNFKNINNIIFLDPLYEKNKNILKVKYKIIFDLFSKKKLNIYNLVIKKSIEEDILKKNLEIINSVQ